MGGPLITGFWDLLGPPIAGFINSNHQELNLMGNHCCWLQGLLTRVTFSPSEKVHQQNCQVLILLFMFHRVSKLIAVFRRIFVGSASVKALSVVLYNAKTTSNRKFVQFWLVPTATFC